ncbi:MAG: hypothetical protein RL654_1764 [Pseudomonadota bacterium]|jgi:hypothetical protein
MAAALGAVVLPTPAQADIYSCVNARGQRLTADRPIAECMDREQQVRGADGSVRRILPPSMTTEERTAAEDKRRREQLEERTRRDAVRHDRNLLSRYPDIERHNEAREAALEPVRSAMQSTDKRTEELERERRQLREEAEFYKGRELPRTLKQKIEQNQVATQAQKDAMQSHQAENRRINASFDQELMRLRQLWTGAAPGSLLTTPAPTAAR